MKAERTIEKRKEGLKMYEQLTELKLNNYRTIPEFDYLDGEEIRLEITLAEFRYRLIEQAKAETRAYHLSAENDVLKEKLQGYDALVAENKLLKDRIRELLEKYEDEKEVFTSNIQRILK